jgi:CheY-like chemotaxis protein
MLLAQMLLVVPISRFSLFTSQPHETGEWGPAAMKHPDQKYVILLVDDDADCREMLADLLSGEGYIVVSAENGREALDYLSGSTPALIILDLMMPVMSGWEFRARQKSDPKLESLPVVVTSASGLVHGIDADAIVSKPIDFGLLMSVVKQNCPSP